MKSFTYLLLLSCQALWVACQHQDLYVPDREHIDLSGTWQTELGPCNLPGTTDENHLGSGEHPTDVTSQLTRLYPYEGIVNYTRTIDLPSSMEGKQLTLIMERTKPSRLIIDGDTIGSHDHLYAPHCYPLPELKAGAHTLTIEVDNSPSRIPAAGIRGSHAWTDATQTNWNGILGKFCIEATPKSHHIVSIQVYPDIRSNKAEVRLRIEAEQPQTIRLQMKGESWNTSASQQTIGLESQEVELKEGENLLSYTLDMGKKPLLWSEFHPALYRLGVFTADNQGGQDAQEVSFGMRQFGTEPYIARQEQGEHVHVGDTIGWLFTINGNRTFLRGKHDGCVFPLTGYAPMDVESWRKVFQVAKQYGINHYRCHSYTPPKAAFLAADIEGIYFDTELPYWGYIGPKDVELQNFLVREGKMILEQLGNSPSFMMLGLGNELRARTTIFQSMVNELRSIDDRHLYNFGANNNLGWSGPVDGEDCFITCRVGGYAPNAPVKDAFSSHVRSSFSFADADDGGILNGVRPNTRLNYTHAVRLCPRPVVSHETCQFQIYPDYNEIQKYTGVLYPYNYEVFRDRLKENGLSNQAQSFHQATGEWSMECYKADIEQVLRTPGMAGYQLLDLQDYPGQGSALCGVLDAFMESKGIITDAAFRQFCSPVVPLALMDSLCYWNDEPLTFDVALCNYLEEDYAAEVSLTLAGDNFVYSTALNPTIVGNGEVRTIGQVCIKEELKKITRPQQLTLTLNCGKYSNNYHLWVYPRVNDQVGEIRIATQLDEATADALTKGAKVLLLPDSAAMAAQSVGGLFTPDYWNYAMFKSISENNNKPVSPGTLGLLYDAGAPLFRNFPGLGRSDWQWWSIVRHSHPMILNALPKEYRPLLQVVDNVERNHKLGMLVELKVGQGALMICPTDLVAIQQYPEGATYRQALLDYMNSSDFAPTTEVSTDDVHQLLTGKTQTRDIQGVENISDYKKR